MEEGIKESYCGRMGKPRESCASEKSRNGDLWQVMGSGCGHGIEMRVPRMLNKREKICRQHLLKLFFFFIKCS